MVIFNQTGVAYRETGIACGFSGNWGWTEVFGPLVAAARGIDKFKEKSYLDNIGHRIFNLERAFNVREGFSRKQDTLPKRMLTEPLHTRGAPGEGQMVRSQDRFLDNYYQLRGWTRNGIPGAARLKELGLGFAVADMAKYE